MGNTTDKNKGRINSIDQFRGFSIISMILVNYLAFYECTPTFLKHAKITGITFADLVAPFFLFILGMMFRGSLLSRIQKGGKRKAYIHAARRYALLILIGMAGGCAGKMKLTFDWGILQTIGLAGLIALPVMALNIKARIISLLVVLTVYHVLIVPHFSKLIINSENGGPLGAVSWSVIIILSGISGEFFKKADIKKSAREMFCLGMLLLSAGYLSQFILPVSKPLVSGSYLLSSCGISIFVFLVFLFIVDQKNINIPTLTALGKNALLIFLLHYILVKAGHVLVPVNSKSIYVGLAALTIYVLCFLMSFILDKKGLYLKL
jgi:predicted acyltransferase